MLHKNISFIFIKLSISMKLVRLIKMCLCEIYTKAQIWKHLSDTSPIKNGPKQGAALSPLLFSFV